MAHFTQNKNIFKISWMNIYAPFETLVYFDVIYRQVLLLAGSHLSRLLHRQIPETARARFLSRSAHYYITQSIK